MKFSCVKEHLERALVIAERFAGKNVSLPVLSSILLEVKGNVLLVSATNLEYAVEISLPGRGTGDGRINVPAKVASSLVQSLPENKVDLEGRKENLFLRTETRDTRINGLAADDFPPLPKIKKVNSLTLEGAVLKKGLERVLPAVSPSEFKPELGGVYFSRSGDTLYMAATDTFRLAEATLPLSGKKEKEPLSFILPYRTGQEVARVCEGEEEVEVAAGENQVEFITPSARVLSRLVEGRFPNYTAIIPKKFDTSCFLQRRALGEAIRAASIFASKLQEIRFRFKENVLVVSASNPEVGEYNTELSAPSSGKITEVSFNHRYILDGINALDEDEIFFGTNGTDGPALIKNKSGDGFIYVLMPIRAA